MSVTNPNSFEDWGLALADRLFPDSARDLPVIMLVHPDLLWDLAGTDTRSEAVSRFGETVGRRLRRDNSYRRGFGLIARECLDWAATPAAAPPPCLPVLAAATFAAGRMRHDENGTSNRYYFHLEELLGVDDGQRNDFRDQYRLQILKFWGYLEIWLNAHEGRRGCSTVDLDGDTQFKYIRPAQSQTIFAASDIDRVAEFRDWRGGDLTSRGPEEDDFAPQSAADKAEDQAHAFRSWIGEKTGQEKYRLSVGAQLLHEEWSRTSRIALGTALDSYSRSRRKGRALIANAGGKSSAIRLILDAGQCHAIARLPFGSDLHSVRCATGKANPIATEVEVLEGFEEFGIVILNLQRPADFVRGDQVIELVDDRSPGVETTLRWNGSAVVAFQRASDTGIYEDTRSIERFEPIRLLVAGTTAASRAVSETLEREIPEMSEGGWWIETLFGLLWSSEIFDLPATAELSELNLPKPRKELKSTRLLLKERDGLRVFGRRPPTYMGDGLPRIIVPSIPLGDSKTLESEALILETRSQKVEREVHAGEEVWLADPLEAINGVVEQGPLKVTMGAQQILLEVIDGSSVPDVSDHGTNLESSRGQDSQVVRDLSQVPTCEFEVHRPDGQPIDRELLWESATCFAIEIERSEEVIVKATIGADNDAFVSEVGEPPCRSPHISRFAFASNPRRVEVVLKPSDPVGHNDQPNRRVGPRPLNVVYTEIGTLLGNWLVANAHQEMTIQRWNDAWRFLAKVKAEPRGVCWLGSPYTTFWLMESIGAIARHESDESRWRAEPAALTLIPNGPVVAHVSGGVDARLKELIRRTKASRSYTEWPQEANLAALYRDCQQRHRMVIPAAHFLSFLELEDAEEFAMNAGLRLQKEPASALRKELLTLDEVAANLEPAARWRIRDRVRRWDPADLDLSDETLIDPTNAEPGFYLISPVSAYGDERLPARGILVDDEGTLRNCPVHDVGIFLATKQAGEVELAWNSYGLDLRVKRDTREVSETFATIKKFRLPANYSRVAVSYSGLPPDLQGVWLNYRNVPQDVAQVLAHNLGVPLLCGHNEGAK